MKNLRHIPALLLIAILVMLSPHAALCAAEKPRDSISVTGSAAAEAEPDMATLSLSVTERGKDAVSTREALAARIDSLNKYLASIHVKRADIKTSGYDLSPYFETVREKRVQRGYIGTASFFVKVRRIADLGAVIDGSASACSASVGNISFGLQKREEIERRLLSVAVDDARARASLVASKGGRKLGTLMSANIGTAGGTPVARDGEYSNALMKSAMAMSAAPTELASGVINVRVTVSLVFELK